MVGRRRRADSTSTVATVDDSTRSYVKESAILKAASPKANPDDWPCFLLVDATVYNADGEVANHLHADLEGPFVLRGRVALEEDQQKYLLNRSFKSRDLWIQVESSTAFSIGLKDEEGLQIPVVWASGQAGWYELVPSTKYQTTSVDMFRAIELYYSILDSYEQGERRLQKKKSKRKTIQDVQLNIDEVLLNYVLSVGDSSTLPDARQRCDDYAIFLLSHFPQGTQFHKWLSERRPDVAFKFANKDSRPTRQPVLQASDRLSLSREIKSASAEVVEERSGSRPKRATRARESIEEQRDNHMTHALGASESGPENIETLAPHTSNETGLATLLDYLQERRQSMLNDMGQAGKRQKHPDDVLYSTFQSQIYLGCSIKHSQGGREVCEYYAGDLAKQLGPEWHQSDFYKWVLKNINTKPKFELISEPEIRTMVRRRKKEKKTTPIIQAPSTPHQGKRPFERSRPLTSGLRPSTGGKKRLRGDDDSDEDMADGLKRSRYFTDDDDVSSVDEDEDDPSSQSPLTRLNLRAENLPSVDPKGPNETWTCDEPDCNFVVRSANEEDQQQLIDEHYEEHERTAKQDTAEAQQAALSRVNLAVQESRGHMPINHLLEKIRGFGSASQTHAEETQDGRRVPNPIKRSLLT